MFSDILQSRKSQRAFRAALVGSTPSDLAVPCELIDFNQGGETVNPDISPALCVLDGRVIETLQEEARAALRSGETHFTPTHKFTGWIERVLTSGNAFATARIDAEKFLIWYDASPANTITEQDRSQGP